ncbi:hypothetical protein, partial [Streptomyces mirabilis]
MFGCGWTGLVAQFPAPLGRGFAPHPPSTRIRSAAGRWGLGAQFPAPLKAWAQYTELWERAVEVARSLRACGVGKDSRV